MAQYIGNTINPAYNRNVYPTTHYGGLPSKQLEDEDHVYLNVNVYNTNPIPQQLSYTLYSTESIITDPSNYKLMIVRFSVPSSDLPILLISPYIIDNPNDANDINYTNLIFSMGIEVPLAAGGTTNIYVNKNVSFIPTNINAPLPSPPASNVPYTGNYYYIYDYVTLLEMFNKAVSEAYNDLITAYDAALPDDDFATKFPNAKVPYFIFETASQKVALVSSNDGFINSDDNTENYIKVYFNYKLYRFFTGFPLINISYDSSTVVWDPVTNVVPNADYQFRILDYDNYYQPTDVVSVDPLSEVVLYNKLEAEFMAYQQYTSPQSILVNSINVPIRYEQTPPIGTSTSAQFNSKQILTDFLIPFDAAGTCRDGLVYTADYLNRFVDMTSTTPLKTFAFNVTWIDSANIEHPFFIKYRENASFKFLFKRIRPIPE